MVWQSGGRVAAGQLLERLTADSSSSTQQSEVPCSRQGLETRYRPGAQSAAEDRRRACRLLWAPERGREEDPALLADPSPARDPAQVWTQASRLPGLYAWHQREQGMKGMGEGDGPLSSTQRLAGSLTRLTACPLLAVPHLVFQSCASPSQEARPLLKRNDSFSLLHVYANPDQHRWAHLRHAHAECFTPPPHTHAAVRALLPHGLG